MDPQVINSLIEDKLEHFNKTVKKLIEDGLKPTHSWMNELQEQTLLRSLEYDKRYQEVSKQTEEVTAKQSLE